MKGLLTLAFAVVGTLLLLLGGAALVFAGSRGGLAAAARDFVAAVPGGDTVWSSPWLGVAGGGALLFAAFWLSRR